MLPQKLRKIEENYIWIQKIFVFMRWLETTIRTKIFEFFAYLRSLNLIGKQYKKIKKNYKIHKGQRCFIIATGPSLTMDDVEKLKNEYTFSMNSICLALDKSDWRPTYYGIQDEHVYEKVEPVLKSLNLKNVFISSNIAKRCNVHNEWIKFPLNISYHSFEQRFHQKYFVKFSEDCFRAVYDGYSITYSLIQIAVYMGFKEIYLLGADCNYEAGKKHHFIEHGHFDPTFATAKDRMLVGYQKAKEYADDHNIKIYNATRGGMLEIFPRVNLDEVLGVKEKR